MSLSHTIVSCSIEEKKLCNEKVKKWQWAFFSNALSVISNLMLSKLIGATCNVYFGEG
jgi:hypothetical protein